jgi:hypothetical protein
MPRTVAIVFNADFSEQLEKISFHTPVWLVDTPENRAAAEAAWQRATEWPHISVTLFRAPSDNLTRDDWRALLDQVNLHERLVDAIDILGVPLTAIARAAIEDVGFARFDETGSGFRVRR